ncbi:hypothetical protein CALCODRAFT_427331, partial [Calocera cornea HHB12733]
SKKTVSRRRKAMKLQSVRQQGHTLVSLRPHVEPVLRKFPNAGVKRIKDWLALKQVFVSEHLIREYNRRFHPEEVRRRQGKRLKRAKAWSEGVFATIAVDQHDKWHEYGLFLHLGVETFSGALLWIEPWWTNKNPRLILSFYLQTVRKHGGIPLITQSDPGSENNGIANAQTMLRQRLDPSLIGKLQHRWMRGHTNIKPEIRWSQLRREFTRAFEDLFAFGVNQGWYSKHDLLQKLVFRWLAIPFLKKNLDEYVRMYNTSKPRRDKNKVLPRGRPEHILYHPSRFDNAHNFKILADEEDFRVVEELYAPRDHPVFRLVPPLFEMEIRGYFKEIDEPEVTMESFWEIYGYLLNAFLRSSSRDRMMTTLALQAEEEMTIEGEHMELVEGERVPDEWEETDEEGDTESDSDVPDLDWSEESLGDEEESRDVIREVEDLTKGL